MITGKMRSRALPSRVVPGVATKWVDPQTEADRAAQRVIVAAFNRRFPTMRVVAEEGDLGSLDNDDDDAPPCDDGETTGGENGRSLGGDATASSSSEESFVLHQAGWGPEHRGIPVDELCVWVDPLDGTKVIVSVRMHSHRAVCMR